MVHKRQKLKYLGNIHKVMGIAKDGKITSWRDIDLNRIQFVVSGSIIVSGMLLISDDAFAVARSIQELTNTIRKKGL